MNKFLLVLLFLSLQLFAKTEVLHIARKDGSILQGYFDLPEGKEAFPLVVLIDGSWNKTILDNYNKLLGRFLSHGMALVGLEKRGIVGETIDQEEFVRHDCLEERAGDYALLLQKLEEGMIPGFNGRCLLIGGSEGGKIAPRVAAEHPSLVQGMVLVGSGGGIPFVEEMRYQYVAASPNPFTRLMRKVRATFLFPHEWDDLVKQTLASPDSLKSWGPKTWKWFASYFRYDPLADLLALDIPVYMIHGKRDVMVPIESAEEVREAFERAGKTNFHLARYEDLGHALSGRDDVYAAMFEWVQQHFR